MMLRSIKLPYRIIAAVGQRRASQNAVCGLSKALNRAKFLNGLYGIVRARRIESAGPYTERPADALINSDSANQEFFGQRAQGFTFEKCLLRVINSPKISGDKFKAAFGSSTAKYLAAVRSRHALTKSVLFLPDDFCRRLQVLLHECGPFEMVSIRCRSKFDVEL